MCVVLTTIWARLASIWLNPHVNFFRAFATKRLNKIVCQFVMVDEDDTEFFCHISRTVEVCSVSIDERIALYYIISLSLAIIVVGNGVLVVPEISADN